jgi:hypothetical protein
MVVISKKTAGRGRGKSVGSKLSVPQPVNLLPETQHAENTQSNQQQHVQTNGTSSAWGANTLTDEPPSHPKTAWAKPIADNVTQETGSLLQEFPSLDASMFTWSIFLNVLRTTTC